MPRNTTRAEPGRRDLTDAARASALFVQSVEKAMTVLSAFHHADGPLTLTQVAERAGIDPHMECPRRSQSDRLPARRTWWDVSPRTRGGALARGVAWPPPRRGSGALV